MTLQEPLPDIEPKPRPEPLPDPVPLTGCPYKANPYPLYEQMREAGPVHRVLFPSGVQAWLVTGYEAAHSALNDDRLGKNHDRGNDRWRSRASIMPEPQHSQLQAHLLHQDAPKHTRMRRFVTDAFTPRRIEQLRPRFQQLADALVDALPETGPADLVATFAARFPFQVLAEVIGLPQELADRFDRDWGKVVQPVGPADPGRPRYEARLHGLQNYIAEVVDHKREHWEDDLLSRLVVARDRRELSPEELDSMIFQLLVAGQEPVTNQITTALIALLRHPDQLTRLRDNPDLLPRAVEELLRYDSAFELTTWRFFDQDNDLHGTEVPAGDSRDRLPLRGQPRPPSLPRPRHPRPRPHPQPPPRLRPRRPLLPRRRPRPHRTPDRPRHPAHPAARPPAGHQGRGHRVDPGRPRPRYQPPARRLRPTPLMPASD